MCRAGVALDAALGAAEMLPAWGGLGLGGLAGLRCQYAFRVCRIQISLQRLEARNHSELVKEALQTRRQTRRCLHKLLFPTRMLIFYLCNQRDDGTITFHLCVKYLSCRKLYIIW